MSQEKFWSALEEVRSVMLAVGHARHVPMAPYVRPQEKAIWFITAAETDIIRAIEAGETAALMIVGGEADLHARIEGTASIVADRARLQDLWSPVVEGWFDGIDDPAVRLVRFAPAAAEVWLSTGTLGFAYAMIKSRLTGDAPDLGEHFSLVF